MKNILLTTAILFAFVLTNCKKEPNEIEVIKEVYIDDSNPDFFLSGAFNNDFDNGYKIDDPIMFVTASEMSDVNSGETIYSEVLKMSQCHIDEGFSIKFSKNIGADLIDCDVRESLYNLESYSINNNTSTNEGVYIEFNRDGEIWRSTGNNGTLSIFSIGLSYFYKKEPTQLGSRKINGVFNCTLINDEGETISAEFEFAILAVAC